MAQFPSVANIRETKSGYLFRSVDGTTTVIPFSTIDAVQSTAPPKASPAAPPKVDSNTKPKPQADPQVVAAKFEHTLELKQDLKNAQDDLTSQSYAGPVLSTITGGVCLVLTIVLVAPASAWFAYDLALSGVDLVGGIIWIAVTAGDVQNDKTKIANLNRELAVMNAQALRVQPVPVPTVSLARF